MSSTVEHNARANVIGAGLIGGSVGMALRQNGWSVAISDKDPALAEEACALGAADTVGIDNDAALSVVAVPVGAVVALVNQLLDSCSGVVTDVGSTKEQICRSIDHPRFVGGHPMAGSEQDGIAGARGDLFEGAMWVLTPSENTSEHSFALVRSMVRSFGAESIALQPLVHDRLVAQVSHVPHLTAAVLMNLADGTSVEHRPLLRLAAGGFRDMTRISAGRTSIWPDICLANDKAIVDSLDRLIVALRSVRDLVHDNDRDGLMKMLEAARSARLNLPVGYGKVEHIAEVAVPIPDRPGEIANIATLAAELDVNILDLEISHSSEGRQGVMTLVVDANRAERFMGGLMARGYHPSLREMERAQEFPDRG